MVTDGAVLRPFRVPSDNASGFSRPFLVRRGGMLSACTLLMANALGAPRVVPFSEAGLRPKLLDQVRDAIRARHYSRRTEQAYVDWIRRYIVFRRVAVAGMPGASREGHRLRPASDCRSTREGKKSATSRRLSMRASPALAAERKLRALACDAALSPAITFTWGSCQDWRRASFPASAATGRARHARFAAKPAEEAWQKRGAS